MREFLLGFDESDRTTPARVSSLIQTFLDFAGSLVGTAQVVPYTAKEANRDLREKVVPVFVKPREGYQLDSPSANEVEYGGLNGDEIKIIDKEIAYLARRNNIPTGYKPPAANMTPSEREAWQRNQGKVAQETLCWSPPAGAKSCQCEKVVQPFPGLYGYGEKAMVPCPCK
jgi:hypothetical protein